MTKKLRRFGLWYWLLTKRLLKRPAFLAILIGVPLLAGAMAGVSRQAAGLLTIAVARRDDDPVAAEAMERLLIRDGVLRFLECATDTEALAAVERGQADAAWIFRAEAGAEVERFVSASGSRGAAIVVEREDNVFLRLARERLAAAIYPAVSRDLFRHYLSDALGNGSGIPDAVMEEYYNAVGFDAKVILFAYAEGRVQETDVNYLVAPIRGLLSMLVVLAGFASCIFYFREEQEESFLWLGGGKRRVLPLLCHFCAAAPVAVTCLPALWAAGLLGDPLHEAACLSCSVWRSRASARRCAALSALRRGWALSSPSSSR